MRPLAAALGMAVASAAAASPTAADRLADLSAGQAPAAAGTLGGAPPGAQRLADPRAAWLSVWVDLDEPELARVPAGQAEARAALRTRILAQQAQVMARLLELGAVEQARVQVVRNAIAVRLPRTRLADAAALPGVRGVRPVQHRNRTRQAPPKLW